MSDERIILGQMLQDPNVFHNAALVSEHFIDGWCRMVFDGISALTEAGKPVNIMTVSKEYGIDGYRLSELTSLAVPATWKYHTDQVKAGARRHWLYQMTCVAKERLEREDTTDEIVEYIEGVMLKVAMSGADDVRKLATNLKAFIDELEERYRARGKLPGVVTGFSSLDEMTSGAEKGRLWYVGARPAKGKSAILLNMLAAAVKSGRRCGIISLESSEREAYARLFSAEGGIRNSDIRQGMFSQSDFGRLTDIATRVDEWPVWICDNPEMTLPEVKAVCRKMVIAHKVEVLYVDYLQYIRETKGEVSRADHIAAVSRGLKAIARQLNVPVIAAAQLRRDADNRRPFLGDFAESSQAEKDADVAILLHDWEDAGMEHHIMIVAKNRDGRTGDVPVIFDKDHAKFKESVDGFRDS